MDDEQKQLKARDRAAKARAVIEDESIQAAFSYLEAEYTKCWKQCETSEGRDRIWMATQTLEKVKEHLAVAIRDGEVAKRILDQIEGSRRKAA
jgi:hypothetical protein